MSTNTDTYQATANNTMFQPAGAGEARSDGPREKDFENGELVKHRLLSACVLIISQVGVVTISMIQWTRTTH